MKLRNILPFLIALALAGGAVFVGKRVLEERNLLGMSADPARAHLRVVVAKEDLDPGQEIRPGQLMLVEMPPKSIPESAFKRIEDVVGRVAAIPVAKGQSVVERALAAKDAGMGLQAIVPAGYRAVNVPADEQSGITNLVVPGCKVDVLATLVDDVTRKTIARTIVENVKVLAVGTETAHRPTPTGSQTIVAKAVTLLVTPKQAEAIELAVSRGRPRLVLRSGRDDLTVPTYGMTMAELVSGAVDMSATRGEEPDFSQGGSAAAGGPSTRPSLAGLPGNPRVGGGSLPPMLGHDPRPGSVEDTTPAAPPRRTIEIIRKGSEQTKQFDLVNNVPIVEDSRNGSTTRPADGGNR